MFAAHDLSDAALGGPIRIQDGHFIDSYGRTLSLRGLNVSGASKLPTTPNGLSHLTESFYEHRTVTFTGRPFPLSEAPLHFRRLREWGLPLIRLLVTWESIGHAGPDPNSDLDLEYIYYLRDLIKLMPRYGIKCFICAHQDVWSRFSGGSGAPGWTFEVAGLDIEAFTDTGAAYVHGQHEERLAKLPANEKEPSGPFLWPSGYQKLAASTMATIFWAGDALAPKLRCHRLDFSSHRELEDVSAQAFLQDAFIEAFGRLADEVGGLEAFLGFEPVNEPHRGLINLHDFHSWNYSTDLHIGHCPSLSQSLALGSGYAQEVPYYVKSWPHPTRVSHKSLIDPEGRSTWLSPKRESGINRPHGMGECVWHAHGLWAWNDEEKVANILQPAYFDRDHRAGREGQPIEWYQDFYAPFLQRFSERVSRKSSRSFSFIEPIPNEFMPSWPLDPSSKAKAARHSVKTTITTPRPRNFVYAPHFYDLNILFRKSHAWMSVNVQGLSRGMFVLRALYFGSRGLRANYRTQIANILSHGRGSLGEIPILVGEVGIPFDINNRHALTTGDYSVQSEVMHALISAMEDNQVGFTLWNYNPHNSVKWGDGWNMEDFSIMNGDEEGVRDERNRGWEGNELYRGGRTLDAIIRPYAAKIAGRAVGSSWDVERLRFEFVWEGVQGGDEVEVMGRTTEIFIPRYHFAEHEISVKVSDGKWSYDPEKQSLYLVQDNVSARHSVVIDVLELREEIDPLARFLFSAAFLVPFGIALVAILVVYLHGYLNGAGTIGELHCVDDI